jgi:hypothetical protein
MRRIRARDPNRPPWDRKVRQRFIEEYEADGLIGARTVEELAEIFEAAHDEAHGSAARFRDELDRRLGL